jgi:hypothetical protein
MYFDAYRRYPYAGRHPSLDPGMPKLCDVLYEYIGRDPRLFACPSDTRYYAACGMSYVYGVRFPANALPTDKGELKGALLQDLEPFHGRFLGMSGTNSLGDF